MGSEVDMRHSLTAGARRPFQRRLAGVFPVLDVVLAYF